MRNANFIWLTIVQGLCFIIAIVLDALPQTHFETVELILVLGLVTATYKYALDYIAKKEKTMEVKNER